MGVLLKLFPIFGLSLVAQLWFNYFNFKFLFSKIKFGDYTVPFVNHVFEWLGTFTITAWTFNAIFCYIPATIMVGQVASLMTSVLFIRLMAGEALNRNGWIAIILILLVLPFAAYSSTNIKP